MRRGQKTPKGGVGARGRAASNANLAGGHDQKFAVVKLGSMLLQHRIEMFDFGSQRSTGEPEEENAGVGETLVKNQLAKITVGNQQNALLSPE